MLPINVWISFPPNHKCSYCKDWEFIGLFLKHKVFTLPINLSSWLFFSIKESFFVWIWNFSIFFLYYSGKTENVLSVSKAYILSTHSPFYHNESQNYFWREAVHIFYYRDLCFQIHPGCETLSYNSKKVLPFEVNQLLHTSAISQGLNQLSNCFILT